jgi:pyruvate/2-oxoglutarate dehydrogenase complex dihydrolipoamide acyltransferase (E2) component
VVDGAIVIRKQATLFVRLDHRLVNGNQAAGFVNTLRTHLTSPHSATLQEPAVVRHAA